MKKSYKIEGMNCSSCARRIEESIKKIPNVKSSSVNFANKKLYLESKKEIGFDEINKIVSKLGDYKLVKENISENEELKELKEAKKRMLFAIYLAAPIMILMMIHMFLVQIPYYFIITAILAFPVILIAGWKTHVGTLKSIKNLSPNMDTLVSMGSAIPYLLSFLAFWFPMTTFVEMAAAIMTLHLVGRFLEAKAKGRASQAIRKLIEMGAKKARIVEKGKEKEIPVGELKINDIMVVKPGEKIPTDGVVISGKSYVDESMATGESKPIEKKKNDLVLGSTINKNGVLKVKVKKVGKDTFLSQVIKLVEEAQGTKVPIQEFADKVTGYFVPAVILIAVGAFISWLLFPNFHLAIIEFFNLPWTNPTAPLLTLAILATTAVLVISCPCALGLATPTALMVGSGLGAEKGILIRKGEAIQTMKDVKMIVFDKTGTITKGKPEVTDIVPFEKFKEKDILSYAGSLEKASEHPLGEAIVEKAKNEKIKLKKVSKFESISGKGIVGIIDKKKVLVGNKKLMKENKIDCKKNLKKQEKLEDEAKTAMFVVVDKKVIGIVAVADTLKENSINTIKEIHKLGIKTAMITGDNERTAKAISQKTGIDYVIAEVLPEGKVGEVKKLQKKYGIVAMVGDGINDAPALKQANVGIAMGTGTDIAIESADITIIRGNLDLVISSIKLSNETFKKIKQNYFWAWFYNGVAIPMAFFGLLHPVIGAGAMAASSLNVVLNSLRLKRINL